MEDKKQKSVAFGMVFDQVHAEALAFIFQTFSQNLNAMKAISGIATQLGQVGQPLFMKYEKELGEILDIFTLKFHQSGWCKDPNCKWEKKHDQLS